MKELNKLIQAKFNEILLTGYVMLFRSEISGQKLWDIYLNSFDNDPIFRDPESSSHNCKLCNNFIRRYGNVVAIDKDYNIVTMFDIDLPKDSEYYKPMRNMSNLLKCAKIVDVFFETFNELNSLPYEKIKNNQSQYRLGIAQNFKKYTPEEVAKFGVVDSEKVYEFNHFHLDLDSRFVKKESSSIESITASYRDNKNVFKRGLDEISLDTLELVRDLIKQGSLLNGDTYLYKVENFIKFKKDYLNIQSDKKDNWCWVNSYEYKEAKFKNELIGVLCSKLSEGKDLNKACEDWNKRVDPANYMKATAPITKKQIEEAEKVVEERGYTESFDRRFATIDDIKASDILHMNVDNKIKKVSLFDNVKATSTQHKRAEFDKVKEVSIDKFMSDILPNSTGVEVFLENRMKGNLVTLTTAVNPNSKKIFKWDNNYSWTYEGNLAGKSMIKEAVKAAGGKVDAALRFSIIWNEDGRDICDLDAHAREKMYGGEHIYYGSNFRKDKTNQKTSSSGQLDIDMIRPYKLGVENIVWDDFFKMKDGDYELIIRNYDGGPNKGFKAEIEFNDEVYQYEYVGNFKGGDVVAVVTLSNGKFNIKHEMPVKDSSLQTVNMYGLDSNMFHKVNLVCLSPNHWSQPIGNKHYFFMLEGCKTDKPIRSFHNENLNEELVQQRKVLEVLALTRQLDPTDNQLSGLGFNATVRDELIVRVSGSHKRVLKIKF